MTDPDKFSQTPLFKMPEWHPLSTTARRTSCTTPNLVQPPNHDVCPESTGKRFTQSALAILAIGATTVLCWAIGKAFP